MNPRLRIFKALTSPSLKTTSLRLSLPLLPVYPQSLAIAQRRPIHHTSTVKSCSSTSRNTVLPVIRYPVLRSSSSKLFAGKVSDFEYKKRNLPLQSGITGTLLIALVLVTAGSYVACVFASQQTLEPSHQQQLDLHHSAENPLDDPMASIQAGRPGNLTPGQEEKLRKLWQIVFQLFDQVNGDPADLLASTGNTPSPATPVTPQDDSKKASGFGMFGRKHSKSTSSLTSPSRNQGGDDKYGETKQFYETLANHSPQVIRNTIWRMVKHDNPDALMLRFLRARKWDVEKALIMMVSTMAWRHKDMHVDDDIMHKGEAGALAGEQSGKASEKKLGADFLAQIRMGKSFLHGTDKQGRPICVVRVRLHKQHEQCEESLERYTVYIIETARMVLSPPVDTATIIFDMTGFSMANMDYTPVKFMIKCFEANYPESLGAVLVHNSPWLFQGIWKVIKGWLDPVVAAKVHFTNSKSDLEEFIAPSQILKELGGKEDWTYKYVEPIPGENDLMKDTATRDSLLEARSDIVNQFEATTKEWISKPEDSEVRAKREQLITKLRENYWNLDPYVRARSLYDRQGVITQGGKVDWYTPTPMAVKTTAGVDTSADDLD